MAPSVLSYFLKYVYYIADGFFIGNFLGDSGLAAINLVWPLVALINALGAGIGMGGAIHFSINHGKGEETKAKEYIKGSFLLMGIFCILLMGILFFLSHPILHALGARGKVMDLSMQYMQIIMWGTFFQIFGAGLIPLVKNIGGNLTAMAAMAFGYLFNVVLDYVFMKRLGWGMAGCALAYITGQFFSVCICLPFLHRQKSLFMAVLPFPVRPVFKKIAKTALSPFGLLFAPNIAVLLMNRSALLYGGSAAVACYAVANYAVSILQNFLQSAADGSQPLMSLLYGRKDNASLFYVLRITFFLGLSVSMLCMAALFVWGGQASRLFGASPQVLALSRTALPIFLWGFPFLGFARVATAYFYAAEQEHFSYILIYFEPLCLLVLLSILPPIFQLPGVWAVIPVSQFILALLAASLIYWGYRKKQRL